MIELGHSQDIKEVHELYLDLYQHLHSNPQDRDGIIHRFAALLERSMDLFLPYLEPFTPHRDRWIIWIRTHTSFCLNESHWIDIKQWVGDPGPYHCPITLVELAAVKPGLIPMLLARVCLVFHGMPIWSGLSTFPPIWGRFAQSYWNHIPDFHMPIGQQIEVDTLQDPC